MAGNAQLWRINQHGRDHHHQPRGQRPEDCRRHGFTLVELLVVITIIGVLMSLLIPVIGRVREMAHRTACINNQSQIGMAMILYATTYGKMPPTMNTTNGLGWAQQMWAQLGRADLANSPTSHVNVSLLVCPSDPTKSGASAGTAPLSYVVNGGCPNAGGSATIPVDWPANGAWSPGMGTVNSATWENIGRHDGTTTTISHSENLDATTYASTTEVNNCILWSPGTSQQTLNSNNPSPSSGIWPRPSSNHPGGCVVGMCDGSVRFIQSSITYPVYAALMTSNGVQASPPGTAYTSGNSYAGYQDAPLDTSAIPW